SCLRGGMPQYLLAVRTGSLISLNAVATDRRNERHPVLASPLQFLPGQDLQLELLRRQWHDGKSRRICSCNPPQSQCEAPPQRNSVPFHWEQDFLQSK